MSKLKMKLKKLLKKSKKCPICHKKIVGYPAISRKDNETEICSECGIVEALNDFYAYELWGDKSERKR